MKSIAAIEAAMHANSNIFLIAQKDMETEEPTAQDSAFAASFQ